ncbi:hypothetical protein BCR37DRAFT_397972 [Protomyces lactucae-debilis]|uniref:CUE domain-containing protein n=1 Tax=Protomyces lactucae-debilis TaxID=2754530 RepID=A0A1Y2FIE0_PROLT|nr:uncharacterized protein BCR37DRAFT_397972 [Protomyces lactucae-debilis]ORY83709.1 hypothetical protein BCR37DRAFT_397972 [Protomyces lactucae-debilis]
MSWVLLLVAAAILFFFLKYFTQESPLSQDEAKSWVDRNIDHVAVMFPQIDRAAIAYDLSKTRNVEQTIETLLAERPLPACPRDSPYSSYRVTTSASSSSAASGTAAGATRGGHAAVSSGQQQQQQHPDLVQRFNLQGRSAETGDVKYTWSKERAQREATLKKRKEDAILRAREKMASTESKTA